MSSLKTLREISGLGVAPCRWAGSTLILIDCQNTYRAGVMKLEGVEAALKAAQVLLQNARDSHAAVIHIQHDAGPGSPYDIREEIGAISPEVAPRAGEPVIVKAYPNAFVQTDLAAHLDRLGTKNVVIAGFMTHMCVNSTARGAFSLGYAPTVVASATATRDLPGSNSVTVAAKALQEASLAALRDLFAVVASTPEEILA